MRHRLELPPLLAAAGGLLLLVSLFLHWYGRLTAWGAFEVWDLVLAALALWALWVVLSPLVWEGPPREASLPLAGIAALVIVASQLINHPPAAAHHHPAAAGAWLALIGSALIAGGGVLSVGRVSLSLWLSVPQRKGFAAEPEPEPPSPGGPSPATEARVAEPEVQEELYPEAERSGPIGADDPEPWTAGSEDETLPFEPDTEEQERT